MRTLSETVTLTLFWCCENHYWSFCELATIPLCVYLVQIELFNDSVGTPLSQLMQPQFSQFEFLVNFREVLLAKKMPEILSLNENILKRENQLNLK